MNAPASRGHNGGPPLSDDFEEDDAGDIRMRFVRFHISDFLNGIRKLPLEARGFYVTGLLCMYDNMGTLPTDDRLAALQLNCDLRTYRRLRQVMLDEKMFGKRGGHWFDTGEGLSQKRCQDEIAKYCAEFRARSSAATKREDEKRARKNAKVASVTDDKDAGKTEQRVDTDPSKSAHSSVSEHLANQDETAEVSENANENNGPTTTVLPEVRAQDDHYARATTLEHKHKPESEEKRESSFAANAAVPDERAGSRGISEAEAEALAAGFCHPPASDDGGCRDEFAPLSELAAPTPPDGHPAPELIAPVPRDGQCLVPVTTMQVEIVEVIPPRRSSSNDSLEAFHAYNDLAQRIGLPIARSFTPGRRRALEARLREHGGLPAWAQILANVERSAFLRGMGGARPGWRADFDFLLQAKSCAKVFDGGYGNGAHGSAPEESRFARRLRMAEAAAERMGLDTGAKP